jgi:beta-glucanase (GH16 family)
MMVNTLHRLLLSCLILRGAHAQSYTKCNPLNEDCPADKALASTIQVDFKQESKYFAAYSHADRISYDEEGVTMTLQERYDNPGLKSNFYIMFGRLEVVLKAAPGRGVVSSFYLQSDDLDEIDLEWVGSDNTEVQTNYFSKGNTTTYTRGMFHGVHEPQLNYHNYTIDWTEDELSFYLDGQHLRTIYSDNPDGYPQSPMYVVTGLWAGGDPSNAPGTIEWAGGEIDYSQAPFSMHVKNVIISDYSTGTKYVYGDRSGEWTSIQAVDGEVGGRYDEAVEEFNMLSAGGSQPSESYSESTNHGSESQAHEETSSSYSRFSTQIPLSGSSSYSRFSTQIPLSGNSTSTSSLVTKSIKDTSPSSQTTVITSSTSIQKDSGSLDNSTDVNESNVAAALIVPGFFSLGSNVYIIGALISAGFLLAI